jgi:AraC-like DNA-binding protein
MQANPLLLNQFRVIDCSGLEGFEAGLDRLVGNWALDAPPRQSRTTTERFVVNYRTLQHVGLLCGHYDAAFSGSTHASNFIQGFPLSGHAEHQIGRTQLPVSVRSSAIVPPGDRLKMSYQGRFDHLALSIKPASMQLKLEALTGAPVIAPLKFTSTVSYERPDTQALRRTALFLAEESSSAQPSPPLVLAELEQAVIVSFLCSNESNYSAQLHGELRGSAPWQVRRVEEYIAAHWDQPITIEALAVATNVSTRSLFHSFKKARGYSPMVLVKQTRLARARDMLSHPNAGMSVTDVAYVCGFGNLGHFANDYQQRFGELPSDTLRSSRSSA